MGAMGPAMLFVCGLAGTAITAAFVLTYAAHLFLDVLEGTAAGNDDIPWPNEPLPDWIFISVYFLCLIALPSVATYFIISWTAPELLSHKLATPAMVLGVIWLIFPILLFSALSGTSRWQLLHFGFLKRLVLRPITTLIFYSTTAMTLAAGVALTVFAVFFPHMAAVLAAFGVAACVLIHARLFGRLGWLLSYRPPRTKPQGKIRPTVKPLAASDPWSIPDNPRVADAPGSPEAIRSYEAAPPPRRHKTDEAIVTLDPWAHPKERSFPPSPQLYSPTTINPPQSEEDEWTPNKKPYAFQDHSSTSAAPSSPAPPIDAITASPFRLRPDNPDENSAGESVTPHARPSDSLPELPQPDRIELRWAEGRRLPPPPRRPFITGVWIFPFRETVLGRFVTLSFWILALLTFARLLASVWEGLSG